MIQVMSLCGEVGDWRNKEVFGAGRSGFGGVDHSEFNQDPTGGVFKNAEKVYHETSCSSTIT